MARILVADDDPDFVEVMRTILQTEGHDVASASNGDQTLAAMRAQAPDLVLLDIMMAYVLDGLNVVRQMRLDPLLRDIPVLVVSSLTGIEGAEMYPVDESVTVDGWISKPVRPADLLQKVNGILGTPRAA